MFLKSRPIQHLSTEFLLKLPWHIFKLNNRMFNSKTRMQMSGTAMGTKIAPSYADIFIE